MAKRFNDRPKKEILTDQDWLLDRGLTLWETSRNDRQDGGLLTAVEALPEPYRSVIEMRYWGRMTYQAIAEEMGWPNRTWTSTYLRRGLARLRAALQAESPPSTDGQTEP